MRTTSAEPTRLISIFDKYSKCRDERDEEESVAENHRGLRGVKIKTHVRTLK
jgi:DICT domain-containing protein